MISSKQRAYLRAIANKQDVLVMIGKTGISDNLITQITETLDSHELIKIKVLETAGLSVREISDALCPTLRAEPVACIGNKLVIYKKNPDKKNSEIILPKK